MSYRRRLIEVSLPLGVINRDSALALSRSGEEVLRAFKENSRVFGSDVNEFEDAE